jgi:arylsulfatase A-like enzyme
MSGFDGLALLSMKKILVLLIFSCFLVGCSGEQNQQPNIVLISIDTLRWDYLATYGYAEQDISPAVDWLAENGIVFDQAVASAGTTVPSHGTMLTGLYPRMHGARSNFHALYPETATITQALADAGYQTGAFVSTNILLDVGELNRGFQEDTLPYDDQNGASWTRSGAKTIDKATKWLDDFDSKRPVFLWLHLWEPHGPYALSERAGKKLEGYDGFLQDGATIEHLHRRGDEIRNSADNIAALQALYSGEVNLADQYLGKFLEDWKARGLLSNTVFIFTADHGQGLGERKRMGHGPSHHEHVIRVPMILSDFRSPEHQRLQTRVGVIDISPTIAELAGLENKFDWFGSSMLRSESLDPKRPFFVEVALRTSRNTNLRSDAWYDPNAVGVWAGNYKLILRKGEYRMFETFSDNRFPRRVALADEPILSDYLAGLIETFQQTELDMESGPVSDEQLQQLRGLGYVQ